MIDWSKLGPSNAPTASTPETTAPVAPAEPGSLAVPAAPASGGITGLAAPTAGSGGAIETGHGFQDATQQQVDALDPGQRVSRGIDFLGNLLFGSDEHSLLKQKVGPVQFAGDVLGAGGNAVHGTADLTVVKPIQLGAGTISRIPLGWVPGGADDTFRELGDKLKANASDPFYAQAYRQWQAVKAVSDGDVLGGGNMKGDFNAEFLKAQDDRLHDSALGSTPDFAIGKSEVGSVGGAISLAINSFLGIGSNVSQRTLGGAGVFDPGGVEANYATALQNQKAVGNASELGNLVIAKVQSGAWTEAQANQFLAANQGSRNRIQEATARLDAGGDISDVEKQAVEAVKSGAWSMEHGEDWLVSHGQGITRNPVGQIAGTVLTDPLTYATLGAGSVAKAGTVGKTILEAGADTSSVYEKLATTVARVQGSQMGPAFRIARGLIDPLGVYKPSTVANATTDLYNAVALSAFERAHGPKAVADVRALARENEFGTELDSAMASYSKDKANELMLMKTQQRLLDEGLGEEMLTNAVGHPDDYAAIMAQNAGRDAETELTDYMFRIANNTWTPDETADLPYRVATSFGKDPGYWANKLPTMSEEARNTLHALTYKQTERGFEEAKATIDRAAYTDAGGKLPLDKMVLMDANTLDDVNGEKIAAAIMSQLEGADEAKIAMATDRWNSLARKYHSLASVGYATGGEDQLKALVKDLRDKIESGGLTKRTKENELADPRLKPLRDFLDRNSVPGRQLDPAEQATQQATRRADAEHAIAALGWTQASTEKFFAAIRKASKVTKSNGRSVGETVYTYPKGEYAKMRLFLAPDGKAGFAIKEDGDLVSVFNGGDVHGAIKDVAQHFGDLGATKLDAFDESGRLPELYGKVGFKEVRREPWNPQYAPPGWKGATPDVIYMERPVSTDGVRRLWNIGFRPDEEVAWGVKRSLQDGRVMYDRVPTISHVVDAVPGRQKFSDTTRNVLGQIIGPSKAERLNRPIDSMEAYVNTLRDGITGQRLVGNMQRRFEKSTFDAGMPKELSSIIWKKARDVAGLDTTTIRGIKPDNLWDAIAEDVGHYRDLRLADGSTVNVHVVMDHLLRASEGDLRIMGLTSQLSQRVRTALHAHGDAANWSGQMTVTMYNKLRYAQPMFLLQRLGDSVYYSILYGVTPVGKGVLKGGAGELEKITENIGRTGIARDFSMDMPEYSVRSNFSTGIKSAMQEAGLKEHLLDKIRSAPDVFIANNMTNMLHARLGDMVQGVIDNIGTAAEKADPEFAAEMLKAGDGLRNSFADWRRIYSENAGRVLDDNEVGLRYVQDQLNAWRRHVVNVDGTLNFKGLIAEGDRLTPDNIGAIESFQPDIMAQEFGYPDVNAMRADYTQSVQKINGEFAVKKGGKDLNRLAEDLKTQFGAHPDKVRRALAYFGDTWDNYWYRLSRTTEKGGLDISSHYAKEAQDLIAMQARERGMDPWEYLSGVVSANMGPKELDTAMGHFIGFLKAGKSDQPLEAWAEQFRNHLDVSAQQTLLHHFESSDLNPIDSVSTLQPAEFKVTTPKSAPGKAARPPIAELPDSFKQEAGYVYRVETPDVMRMGLPEKAGVSTGKPTAFYAGKDGIQKAIYRFKDEPGLLSTGRHGVGGADRLTTKAIKPEDIEMLTADGSWVSLGQDPMTQIMSKDLPAVVRERMASGVPHPNPEVDGYIQAFAKWVKSAIPTDELAGRTRSDLRNLVEQVPTANAVNYNRTHALVVSLLKNKIEDAQQDVFRLAEMQTKRTVIERSLNHPLFGLYPASYMWGKVLPETVKFLAKNPYAATNVIADVQRAIATQREYDPNFENKMSSIDRSAGAFLADYLTPGLPWSDHQARMSPLVRDILKGDFSKVWPDELATVSPDRWISQISRTAGEIPGAIDSFQTPTTTAPGLKALQGLPGAQPSAPAGPGQITGPTPAAALAPILRDDLTRLQDIFLPAPNPGQ